MKKVAIIGIVGVPANYGGYETMVENMLDYTPDDVEYTVYCSKSAYKEEVKEYKGAKLKYYPFKANGGQSLIYDALCLRHAYFHSDVILALGNCGSYLLPLLRLFGHKKIIYHYDGFELKRNKWNPIAKAVMKTLMTFSAKYSDIHISDNEAITPMIEEFSRKKAVLIEYGGDGAFVVRDSIKLQQKYNLLANDYFFNVARIEPENNIHVMLKAFSQMPDKTLMIVGNWHKSQYGEDLLKEYAEFKNIRMQTPIYEPEEINLLRSNCKLYIHPHSVGGTNPSLVEAMFLGVPIIAFDVVYNRATTENKCLYFKDVETLINAINTEGKSFSSIAADMKEIANRRYRWSIISEKYCELY